MKKSLIIGLILLISKTIMAGCLGVEATNLPEKCYEINKDKNYCPTGTILTFNEMFQDNPSPRCISCESEETILIIPNCTSVEEIRTICPNRYIDYGCNDLSVLKCDFKPADEKNHICNHLSPNVIY